MVVAAKPKVDKTKVVEGAAAITAVVVERVSATVVFEWPHDLAHVRRFLCRDHHDHAESCCCLCEKNFDHEDSEKRVDQSDGKKR